LFDTRSEEFALANLEKFEDALLRNLLWMDLYNCVRDASMKSTAYLKLVRDKLGFEDTGKLVQSVVRRVSASLVNFVPSKLRPEEAAAMFEFYWSQLQKAGVEEWQIIWANALLSVAESKANVEKLSKYLVEGSKITHEFSLDQGMRWSVVVKAVSHGLANANDLLEAEQKRDPSDRGQRSVLTAKASVPTQKTKEEAWERYVAKEQKQSFHLMSSDMNGFSWFHQKELVAPFTDKFFDVIRTVFKDHEREYAVAFFGSLFPGDAENQHGLDRAKALLHTLHVEEDQILVRNLKEEIDDLERAQKALALFK
jgi:aminopeptidase N